MLTCAAKSYRAITYLIRGAGGLGLGFNGGGGGGGRFDAAVVGVGDKFLGDTEYGGGGAN